MNNLYLFTFSYPFGTSETFLETEIQVLSSHFKHIYIIPLQNTTGDRRNIPDNSTVVDFKYYLPFSRVKQFLSNFITVSFIFFFEIFYSVYRKKYLTSPFYFLNKLLHVSNVANRLQLLIEKDASVCYSYWYNQWVFPLSIIKFKNQGGRLLTRIHGADVYEDQHEKDFFFHFRKFQNKHIDMIVSISENGRRHFVERNSETLCKTFVSYLGVMDKGTNRFSELAPSILVTCSSINNHKRVDLMIDVLKGVKSKIQWVHFGDGDLRGELIHKSLELPSHVDFVFKGQVANSIVIDFYKSNKVDLFINLSYTEGIPVSIMEAMSFGIPCIATDVGGVKEIINEENGILINRDFNPNDISEIIDKYLSLDSTSKNELRNIVKRFWSEKFNAVYNYSKFVNTYLKCVE